MQKMSSQEEMDKVAIQLADNYGVKGFEVSASKRIRKEKMKIERNANRIIKESDKEIRNGVRIVRSLKKERMKLNY